MKAGKQPAREDHAAGAGITAGVRIHIKGLVFQTGNAIIGGDGDILSFTDEAAHEAVPNDDDSRVAYWTGVTASEKHETHQISFVQDAVDRGASTKTKDTM